MKTVLKLTLPLLFAVPAITNAQISGISPVSTEKRMICSCSGMFSVPGGGYGAIGIAYEAAPGTSCYPPSWCIPGTGFGWMVITVGNETISGTPSDYAYGTVCGACNYA
jgi:hypothetical protein